MTAHRPLCLLYQSSVTSPTNKLNNTDPVHLVSTRQYCMLLPSTSGRALVHRRSKRERGVQYCSDGCSCRSPPCFNAILQSQLLLQVITVYRIRYRTVVTAAPAGHHRVSYQIPYCSDSCSCRSPPSLRYSTVVTAAPAGHHRVSYQIPYCSDSCSCRSSPCIVSDTVL